MKTWLLISMLVFVHHKTVISQVEDFRVSTAGTAIFRPDISADSFGNFVVVWTDYGDAEGYGGVGPTGHIYGQRYRFDGTPIGSNFRVTDDGTFGPLLPAVSMNNRGDFVVAWTENRSKIWGDLAAYAQRYDAEGLPLGKNFRVNNDTTQFGQIAEAVALRSDGSFIIAWVDSRLATEGKADILVQLFDRHGEKVGRSFTVNELLGSARVGCSMAAFEDGGFVIVWLSSEGLRGQLYTLEGRPQGANFNISRAGYAPAVAAKSNGQFIVTLVSQLGGDANIYARYFDRNGNPLNETFRVNDDTTRLDQWGAEVAVSREGQTVIVWEDYRNDYSIAHTSAKIYAQRFDFVGRPIGSNFKVTHETIPCSEQREPAMFFQDGRIFTVWIDTRDTTRLPANPLFWKIDVWGNILPFENPEAGEMLQCEPVFPRYIPKVHALKQNFPNPFNRGTIIEYELAEDADTELKLYNLFGQEVATLKNGFQEAGRHHVSVDDSSLPSGICFYRLTVRAKESSKTFVQSKRMVLVR